MILKALEAKLTGANSFQVFKWLTLHLFIGYLEGKAIVRYACRTLILLLSFYKVLLLTMAGHSGLMKSDA